LHAILEGIAFRVFQIWETLCAEIAIGEECVVRLCGGVSNNDFICQQIASLLNMRVERIAECQFSGAKGAVLLAGISSDVWTIDLVDWFVDVERTFFPCSMDGRLALLQRYTFWQKAQKRCLDFYK